MSIHIVMTSTGSGIAAMMMEHLHGRRDLYDIRAYDVRRNASADVVRWALKDLRRQHFSNYLVICSPDIVEVVLTQVCTELHVGFIFDVEIICSLFYDPFLDI